MRLDKMMVTFGWQILSNMKLYIGSHQEGESILYSLVLHNIIVGEFIHL